MENVKITKTYTCGVEDKKAKRVDVPCFAMDVDRGRNSMGVCEISSGSKVAFALTDGGRRVLPDLYMADVVGFYANGFRVRGFCDEVLAGKSRRFYCEWFVFYGKQS